MILDGIFQCACRWLLQIDSGNLFRPQQGGSVHCAGEEGNDDPWLCSLSVEGGGDLLQYKKQSIEVDRLQ